MFQIFLSPDQPYNKKNTKKPGSVLMAVGGTFIIFGIVIVLFPEILVMLISSVFVLIGVLLFSLGSFLHKRK